MKNKLDSNIKKLICYVVIIVVFIIGLMMLGCSNIASNFPIKNNNIMLMQQNIKNKAQEISNMNKTIKTIKLKEPELREKAVMLSESSTFMINDGKDKVADIPSLYVYLEQTGKKEEIKVKKIEIMNKAEDIKNKQELIIFGEGTYENFISYLKSIQFNTVEIINIEDFEINCSNSDKSLYEFKLVISI